jgi:hypothetical protein
LTQLGEEVEDVTMGGCCWDPVHRGGDLVGDRGGRCRIGEDLPDCCPERIERENRAVLADQELGAIDVPDAHSQSPAEGVAVNRAGSPAWGSDRYLRHDRPPPAARARHVAQDGRGVSQAVIGEDERRHRGRETGQSVKSRTLRHGASETLGDQGTRGIARQDRIKARA